MVAAVRGRDPRPVPEQEGPRAIAAATDQREQVRLFAADVVAGAARADDELRALYERLHADRRRNLTALVAALRRNGPLALDDEAALETVWALTSPELHQLLVGVRGWSRRRYTTWLTERLTTLLVPPARRTRPGGR
jgi:hypothetical protein